MKAVFLDFDSDSAADLDVSRLRSVLPDLTFYDRTAAHELPGRIRDAEIVLLDQCPLGSEQQRLAAHLRLIALVATGYNHIDIAAAAAHGIAVSNVRDYCTPSVVQHVWSLILSLTQRLGDYQRLATGGAWARGEPINVRTHSIRELAGRTLGIVGWGTLGRGVARIGEAFGMHVLVAVRPGDAPTPGRVPLREVLARSDVLSLHCPLTAATQGLIGATELASMKPDALLINTARGALVDSTALAAALRAGRLGGAGIDVLVEEPPRGGDPLLDPSIPNLLVTPHVAWAAREARQRSIDEVTLNVTDFLAGGRRGRIV